MTDGLIEDEFANRPDDDELAFVYFEKIFRKRLDDAMERNSSYDYHMRTYANSVIATARALDLEILRAWIQSPGAASNPENFSEIQQEIDSEVIQIKIRHAEKIRKNSVKLAAPVREKIRELIGKIKTTIESIDLSVERKESLMNKLNAFSNEVDRDRTRYEAFAALFIDAAGKIGQAERKLRPIKKWIDSIANLLNAAKADEDSVKRLPSPPKRIEASPRNDSDDEPPF